MKSKIIKSALLAGLLLQSTAQASWFTDTISYIWENYKPVVIAAGVLGTLKCAHSLYKYVAQSVDIKKYSVSQKLPRLNQVAVIADVYGISNALMTSGLQNPRVLTINATAQSADENCNALQKDFLTRFYDPNSFTYIPDGLFKAQREFTAPFRLNQFFEQNNLSHVTINPWNQRNGIAVGSIVSFHPLLKIQAQEANIFGERARYRAMHIDKNCYVYNCNAQGAFTNAKRIVINAAGGLVINIVKTDNCECDFDHQKDLLDCIAKLIKKSKEKPRKAIATLPVINLHQENDISWLEGMKIGAHTIAASKQHVSFKFDGTQAPRILRPSAPKERDNEDEAPREKITIDNDFIIWVTGYGAKHPLFAAYIPKACWQKIS